MSSTDGSGRTDPIRRFRSTTFHRSLLNPIYQEMYDDIRRALYSEDLVSECDAITDDAVDVRRILTGVLNDNPCIFWVKDSVSVTRYRDRLVVRMQPNEFFDDRRNLSSEVRRCCDAILDTLKDRVRNEYEASVVLHDHLTSNVRYRDTGGCACHRIIGPLLHSEGVCDGISDTYNLLMNAMGVRCTTVNGHTHDSPTGHSWNISVLDDSAYHTDVTFDLGGSHRFLNLDDRSMSLTHRFRRYMCCDSMDLNYHKVNGTFFDTVDEADSFIRSDMFDRRNGSEFMVLEPSDNGHFLGVVRSAGYRGRWISESSEDGRGFRLRRVRSVL